jgi:hypothetical protein
MDDTTTEAALIGRGQLTWPRGERISDRYGCVGLMEAHDGFEASQTAAPIDIRAAAEPLVDRVGTLRVKVLESRRSHHIGDFFRGLFPPEVPLPAGATVTLGTGRLFTGRVDDMVTVGLEPVEGIKRGWVDDQGSGSDWLDPKALYSVHDLTVELRFAPREAS